uniref:Alpha-macroglobulin receptor-binding domain-containing protein n=1 Tax=Sinocyclocheilus anshuiensis TaxID=1608454 RepID=A0A671NLG2_9TELE
MSETWASISLYALIALRSFMVTFPAVIESGSEAKLCASFLKPNESLAMNIYLVHGDQSTLLLQEKAEEEFHRCFNFQILQTMKVELQGKNFKMTEKKKVMFRFCNLMLYHITHFTVNFRVVTMDRNFVPFDQKDSQNNRIGQWTNISSTRWILQLSHELNPEARQVLPKFEITMKAPKELSFGDSDMNMKHEIHRYTFGQPVAGKARVEVYCIIVCCQMSEMGCASFTLDTSVFFNSINERFLKEHVIVKVNVTEEGTGDRSKQNSFGLQKKKSPTLSELIIENIEQPLKCDAEFTVAIKYYFVGETVEELKTDIVYIVSTIAACSLMAQCYNIPTPTEAKTLSIDAKIEGDCKKTFGQNLLLNFTVNYNAASYDPFKLLSGFTADTSLVTSLVERVDSKDDHVIVYLTEVPKNIPVNLQIKLKQVLPVKNLKPAVIKVYDYYQTSDQSETEYKSHCE